MLNWNWLNWHRARLARQNRDFAEAEPLTRKGIERQRQRAAAALAVAPDSRDTAQRNLVRELAVAIESLGRVELDRGDPRCVESYKEAVGLYQQLRLQPEEAVGAIHLGDAYVSIHALLDADSAEGWYRRSLGLVDSNDNLHRAQCIGQLGRVAMIRVEKALDDGRPDAEIISHLNDAVGHYQMALELLPNTAVRDLHATHDSLANIYAQIGKIENALQHYQRAIQYAKEAEDPYLAAKTRHNAGFALLRVGRLGDARAYAEAALSDYRQFGNRAPDEMRGTQALIARINAEIAKGGRR
jgi:tetratricopeptide (TPR) repeat protein